MGLLLLLRHGQASLGSANYDELSPLGRRQSRLAGERLARAEMTIERVVCGALVRQRDTAHEAMSALGIEPSRLERDDRLDEYDHVGVLAAHTSTVSFEGAIDAEANRAVQPALELAIAHWADGGGEGYDESHDEFVKRVNDVISALTSSPGTTLVVTSGGVVALASAQLLGLSVDHWPALARITVNASLTKIISGRTGTQLVTFNDHAHLEPDRSLITYR